MTKNILMVKRSIASAVIAALIVLVPGPEFYQALAAVVQIPVSGASSGIVVPIVVPGAVGAMGPAAGDALKVNGLTGTSFASALIPSAKPVVSQEALPTAALPFLNGGNRLDPLPAKAVPLGSNAVARPLESIAVSRTAATAEMLDSAAQTLQEPLRQIAAADLQPASAYTFGEKVASVLLNLKVRKYGAEPIVASVAERSEQAPSAKDAKSPTDPDKSKLSGSGTGKQADAKTEVVVPVPAATVQKAYAAGKTKRNLLTAGAFAGIAAFLTGTAAVLAATTGWAAVNTSVLALTGLLSLPIVQEIWNRFRHRVPQDLPLLSKKDHPDVYAAVSKMAKKAGIDMPRLLYWEIDSPNAAAMGMRLPVQVTKSYVLFTKSILEMMSPEELAGVVGHELSHIRHNDILLNVGAKLAGMLLFFVAVPTPLPMLVLAGAVVASTLLENFIGSQREYLADLGGAQLNGKPEPLASGLLRLDIFGMLVSGFGGPVNQFDPERLIEEHPTTLSRAENLLGMIRKVTPAVSKGVPSSLFRYLQVLVKLTAAPVLVLAFFKLGIIGFIGIGAAYAAAKGVLFVRSRFQTPSIENLRRALGVYLTHPDASIKKAVLRALLDFINLTDGIRTARGVRLALSDAGKTEQAVDMKNTLHGIESYYQGLEKAQVGQLKSLQDTIRQNLSQVVAQAQATRKVRALGKKQKAALLALLPAGAAEAPKAQESGLPDRAAVRKIQVYLVGAQPRGPPALALFNTGSSLLARFWSVDAEKREVFISKALWKVLSPAKRAWFMTYLTGLVQAELKAKQSGQDWIEGTPEVEDADLALKKAMPLLHRPFWVENKGVRLLKSYLEKNDPSMRKPTLKERAAQYAKIAGAYAYQALIWFAKQVVAVEHGAVMAAIVAAGAVMSVFIGWVAIPLSILNFLVIARFNQLGWSKGRAWLLKPVAVLLPSIALEVIGALLGAPLLGGVVMLVQSLVTGYLLQQNFKKGIPDRLQLGLSLASTFVMGAMMFSTPWLGLLGAVSMAALYLKLAQYKRRGLLAYGASGAGLVALFAVMAAFAGPLWAGFVTAIAAHLLGTYLTRNLKAPEGGEASAKNAGKA